jgi:hypothetical protein
MEIKSKTGKPIKNLKDWEEAIPKKDWVEGRSAYSLASFILSNNGLEQLKSILEALLEDEIVFEEAIPEYEIRFDTFGKGRFHDLGIFAMTKSSNKKVFVGIESKVDEAFGQTVSEAYISAIIKRLNGEITNAPVRIEKLLKQNFGNKVKSKHFDIRYQFLYATMGTLKKNTDISIFFTIVFKTDSYNKIVGNKNYRDYCQFIQNVISEKIPCNIDDVEVHKLTIDNRELYSIYKEIDYSETIMD